MSDYYVGLDVYKASICIAVLNADGKLVMESVVETSAATILDFLKGLRRRLEGDFRRRHSRCLALRYIEENESYSHRLRSTSEPPAL
jgi:hypothetical protein